MGMFKNYFTPGRVPEGNEKEQKSKSGKKNKKATPSEDNSEGTSPFDGRDGTTVSYNPGTSASRSVSGSRPGSIFGGSTDMQRDRQVEIMCNWLYQQQLEKQYATGMIPGEGVVIKKDSENFACYPPQLADMPGSLHEMAKALNVPVSFQSGRIISPRALIQHSDTV